MRSTALAAVAALSVLLVVPFAGCQDPTGVGAGLIDGSTADPDSRNVDATQVDTVGATLTTAGFASNQSAQPQQRVLVGRVQDAAFGDAAAVAYLDATQPTNLPTGFQGARTTSVTLELRRDYVYGDTTATLPVDVRLEAGNWSPEGLPADTVLATGDLITTVNLNVQDTVATFAMPAAWVQANDTLFTSAQFGTLFEGFALSVAEGAGPLPGAVVGFNLYSPQSRIRVATATDTVSYPLAEVYTYLTRQPPAMAPPGLVPIRGGAPQALSFAFDLAPVGAVPLARALVELPLDRSLVRQGTFLRPIPPRVALFAVTASGTRTQVGELVSVRGRDPRTSNPAALTTIVQRLLLGQTPAERFEVAFPSTPLSLDVLPVYATGGAAPRLLLTVVAPS